MVKAEKIRNKTNKVVLNSNPKYKINAHKPILIQISDLIKWERTDKSPMQSKSK